MNENRHAEDKATEAQGQEFPTDAALLVELLDDIDTIVGMLERTREAAAKGKTEVRLIPRGKVRSIAQALDELGDVLTRRTLQVRSLRAMRDGEADAKLAAILGELGEDTATEPDAS